MEIKQLIARAQHDHAFRQALIADPKRTLESVLGVILPDNVVIQVHEQTAQTIHLVLPPKPPTEPA